MPMDAQTRLLRVLQSGEFTTVGGSRPIKADVRIIAATHKDLPALIASGQFREDLYFRLNVVPIALPALRQRAADVGLLSQHFLDRAALEGLPRKGITADAIARLGQHDWPGNVRELENLMRRLAVLARDDLIGRDMIEQQLVGRASKAEVPVIVARSGLANAVEHHLAAYFAEFGSSLPPDGLYDRILEDVERPLLLATMSAVRGNQLRAAKLLGINRNTLRKKLNDLGVDPSVGRR